MVAVHGIPTTYRRAEFRSRLEARWASFFDLISWKWTYEPLDADGYIPDFLIHGGRPLFIEVGNCILQDDFVAKSKKPNGAVDQLGHDVLVVGINPLADIPANGEVGAGWLADYFPATDETEPVYGWSTGRWVVCPTCRGYGVNSLDQHFVVRPCGHYHGGKSLPEPDRYQLDALWNHAGSVTQWKPWKR